MKTSNHKCTRIDADSGGVHPKVRASLNALLERYQSKGVDVFVFGSLAKTWPEAQKGADLDLGYDSSRLPAGAFDLISELESDVETLPTIRPVDLVDLASVSKAFRIEAMRYVRRKL